MGRKHADPRLLGELLPLWTPKAGEFTARFEGRDLLYGFGELDALVPAYAATVHKSQGSEYPAVVTPVLTQHYAMLKPEFDSSSYILSSCARRLLTISRR